MKVKFITFFIFIIIILAWSTERVLFPKDLNAQNDVEKPAQETVNQPIDVLPTINPAKAEENTGLWSAVERKESYNNELQYYSKENVSINENELIITSKREKKENMPYTSGLVESNNAYLYGDFEFDIKISEGKGIFPAIWLMPADSSSLPEIDIFEMIGSAPQLFSGVLHYLDENGLKNRSYFEKKVERKDSYKLELRWSENEITWYIDGELVHKATSGVPHKYMYIIINQAIGGNWPGNPDEHTPFPLKFTVKASKINPVNEKRRY